MKAAVERLVRFVAYRFWAVLFEGFDRGGLSRLAHGHILADKRARCPDLPMLHGFKVYSQADEDGIIEHILDRLAIDAPSFVECGCGDGIENNTHYLLLKGGRGLWVDGEPANVAGIGRRLGGLSFPGRLEIAQTLMTPETVGEVLDRACAFCGVDQLDVFSLDVDSIEGALLAAMLETPHRPALLVVEYNAKFPPRLAISSRLEAGGRHDDDDYFGASLAWLAAILSDEYRLVSCSASGVNAFFVRRGLADRLPDYPLADVYQPAAYYLTRLSSGHRHSAKFLTDLLKG